MRVTTRDGSVISLVVSRVDDTTLYGSDGRREVAVPLNQIVRVETQQFDLKETVAGAGEAVVGAAAISAVIVGAFIKGALEGRTSY